MAGTVPPAVFVPQPNVDSALVRLRRYEVPPVAVSDPERMFELVRAGFATRRKMLRRGLDSRFHLNPDDRDEWVFERAGIDPSARAETLALAEWAALANAEAGRQPEVRVDAFAKLTLSLHVTGTCADGYHELDALVVSVSEPRDELVIRPAIATTISVSGPNTAGVPTDETNLAVARGGRTRRRRGDRLAQGHPAGAGLGGGSADAAAVLIGAPSAAGLDVHYLEVERIAATLGADVPFCVSRGGAMRMRGIGDDLEPVNLPDLAVVIATPPFGCANVDVYRAWDELGGPEGETVTIDGLPPLRNDLEPAAHRVRAALARVQGGGRARRGRARAARGQRVFVRRRVRQHRRRGGGAQRVDDAVDAQVVVGLTIESGVRLRR